MNQSSAGLFQDLGIHINREIVVVIDPGHGGLNGGADDGASYDGRTERFINLQTANAMYDELSQYDNVKVYLTRNSPDVQMSLKERAQFAQSVGADYLISLHFNASESHLLYGSEVWIPSVGNYYVEGYKIGDAVLKEFRTLGLNIRGIKTRVGDDGDEYYGIIRESEKLGINSVIIEHCHLDNSNDSRFCDSETDFVQFGKADATALAKYLGLSSSKLSVDYSAYQNVNINVPGSRVYQDSTPPDRCNVELAKNVKGDGNLEFCIEAYDSQSGLNYYSYSLDGGNSYSDLFVWNDNDGDGAINVILNGIHVNNAELVVRVYNKYDLFTESNMLTVSGIKEEENGHTDTENTTDSLPGTTETTHDFNTETKDLSHEASRYDNKDKLGIGAVLVCLGVCLTAILVKKLGKHGR